MKEHPILFKPDMIRAILAGRKTMTRRLVKPQPGKFHTVLRHLDGWGLAAVFGGVSEIRCPFGQPGDRLWVRESWRSSKCADGLKPRQLYRHGYPVWYESDGTNYFPASTVGGPGFMGEGKLRPSIFMPRWASRITLEITDIRVERVQDISEEDAKCEGVEIVGGSTSCEPYRNYSIPKNKPGFGFSTAARSFASLWDSINGKKYPWASNPWVWAVGFSVDKVKT